MVTFGLRVGGKSKLVVAFEMGEEKAEMEEGALTAKVRGIETGGIEFEDHGEVPKCTA